MSAVAEAAVALVAGNGMAEGQATAPGLLVEAPRRPARRSVKADAAEATNGAARGLELLLWVAAGGGPEGALAAKACGVSRQALRNLRLEHPEAARRAMELRRLGEAISRDELSLLLRARVAEMLIQASGASELAALLRVFDKLPVLDSEAQARAEADRAAVDPLAGITELDLAASVAEARRLLEEIDAEEAGGRLAVAAAAGENGA